MPFASRLYIGRETLPVIVNLVRLVQNDDAIAGKIVRGADGLRREIGKVLLQAVEIGSLLESGDVGLIAVGQAFDRFAVFVFGERGLSRLERRPDFGERRGELSDV